MAAGYGGKVWINGQPIEGVSVKWEPIQLDESSYSTLKEAIDKSVMGGMGIPQGIFTGDCSVSYASMKAAADQFEIAIGDYLCKALHDIQEEAARQSYVSLVQDEIERRLPSDFTQGRDKLAAALAESEYDFATQLARWAERHRVPVR